MAVFTNPYGVSLTCIPYPPWSCLLPFLHFPLISLSETLWPSSWCWMRHTSVQGLWIYPPLCLLSLSSKYWQDPLFCFLLIFLQMLFSQWDLPCPLNFKSQITPNPSILYLLSSTYHYLTCYIFYLFMYLFQQLSQPHRWTLWSQGFSTVWFTAIFLNLHEWLAHSKTLVNINWITGYMCW